ncbi:MAG: hypothetical protein GX958_12610 [Desulfitobacterium sp.]|nr:hypothetical protein [Desulfitobacterium sp.]
MTNKSFLEKKLDDLINLMMTDGVQPNDLADNIFLEPYTQVSYKKVSGQVIGELHFEEEKNVITVLRYFYGNDKKVYRIEEQIQDSVKTLWDREFEEKQIINEVVKIMEEYYNSSQIEKFISTLPPSIRGHLNNKLKEHAS